MIFNYTYAPTFYKSLKSGLQVCKHLSPFYTMLSLMHLSKELVIYHPLAIYVDFLNIKYKGVTTPSLNSWRT